MSTLGRTLNKASQHSGVAESQIHLNWVEIMRRTKYQDLGVVVFLVLLIRIRIR